MRRRGLLMTPEETETPPELKQLETMMAAGGFGAEAADTAGDEAGKPTEQLAPIRIATSEQSVPERVPLPMEASVLKYLRPRDALAIFHRAA